MGSDRDQEFVDFVHGASPRLLKTAWFICGDRFRPKSSSKPRSSGCTCAGATCVRPHRWRTPARSCSTCTSTSNAALLARCRWPAPRAVGHGRRPRGGRLRGAAPAPTTTSGTTGCRPSVLRRDLRSRDRRHPQRQHRHRQIHGLTRSGQATRTAHTGGELPRPADFTDLLEDVSAPPMHVDAETVLTRGRRRRLRRRLYGTATVLAAAALVAPVAAALRADPAPPAVPAVSPPVDCASAGQGAKPDWTVAGQWTSYRHADPAGSGLQRRLPGPECRGGSRIGKQCVDG